MLGEATGEAVMGGMVWGRQGRCVLSRTEALLATCCPFPPSPSH
jgi:hypothetical protein